MEISWILPFPFLWQNDWIHTEGKFWYFVNLSSLGLSENVENVHITSGTKFYVCQNCFQVNVIVFWDLKLFIYFQPVVIDARGHLMGRLASTVAKFILNGNKVVVVRCEAINMSGNFYRNKLKYLKFLRLRCNVKPLRGKQKFFSFDDLTWSKELSDQWIFLKQNLCHKKPKVTRQ